MPDQIIEEGDEKSTGLLEFEKSIEDYILTPLQEKKDKSTKEMRGFISKILKQDVISSLPQFKTLDKADFIKKILPSFLREDDVKITDSDGKLIDNMEICQIIEHEKDGEKLYINCRGLLEARKLMYDTDGKSISVPYRCIDRNLPRFTKNYHLLKKIKTEKPNLFDWKKITSDFADKIKMIESLTGLVVNDVIDLFQPKFYLAYLNQDGIECYNAIIGNDTNKDSSILGLNEYINQYNQLVKKNKGDGVNQLVKLNNQILFGDYKRIEHLTEHHEAVSVMKEVVRGLKSIGAFNGCTSDNKAYVFLQDLSQYNHDVFINAKYITNISNTLYKDFSILYDAVKRDKNGKIIQKSITLRNINDYIETLKLEDDANVYDYFRKCYVNSVSDQTAKVNLFVQLQEIYEIFCDNNILTKDFNLQKVYNEEEKKRIQHLFDGILELQRYFRMFLPSLYEMSADGLFVKDFGSLWAVLSKIDKSYNVLRNLFTRKPYSEDKIRIHFGLSNVMDGFVDSWSGVNDKGTQFYGYILRKKNSYYDINISKELQDFQQYEYYLVISQNTKLFRNGDYKDCETKKRDLIESNTFSGFERFDYYQSSVNNFLRSFNHINGKDVKSYKDKILKESNEDKCKCLKQDYIDRLVATAKEIKRLTALQDFISDENIEKYKYDYEALENDLKHIIEITRERKYIPISTEELMAIRKGLKPTYLFRIVNKDLLFADTMSEGKRKSHGKENLHTMYLRALLDEKQTVFDIGTGCVYFRPASDKQKIKYNDNVPTHERGKKIPFKNPYNIGKEESVFEYNLIKYRRFSKDSYHLYLSLTQNMLAAEDDKELNYLVQEYVKTQADIRIIGIDRGERNLIYATMIDLEGNIIEQKSFNIVKNEGVSANGEPYHVETDYHSLLKAKAEQMKKKQKEWSEAEKIVDVKDGYLSIVVHEIAKMVVENNAILVMEDLSQSFMNTRQSQLANVYQKFEDKLTQKLQYYIDKEKSISAHAGLYNALQLAGLQSKNFQNGFIFYVRAWNTSNIDPITGFVNFFSIKYTNIPDAKNFIKKFDSITKNQENGHYEFKFKYSKIKAKRYIKNTRDEWVLSTHGGRIVHEMKNNHHTFREIESLTSEYDSLFDKYKIDTTLDLKAELLKYNNADLFKDLFRLLKWTLQLRNYDDKGNDFIVSPVAYNDNLYYCSNDYDNDEERCVSKFHDKLPRDADANGAFNIARKGLLLVNKIKKNQAANMKISDEEWLQYVQKRYVY